MYFVVDNYDICPINGGIPMSEISLQEIFKEEKINQPIKSKFDLIGLTKKGISKKSLLKLADLFSLSVKDLSKILPVTERTIQRNDLNKKFRMDVSEHIILLAEVYSKGSEVFEEQDDLIKWLKTPNRSFSKMKPLDILDTSFGVQLVIDELGRLEHGVYS